MVTTDDAWKELESQFRLLHQPSEKFRAVRQPRRPWTLLGADEQKQERFRILARLAGGAAGVPPRASAVDGWINLLAANSPHGKGDYVSYCRPGEEPTGRVE